MAVTLTQFANVARTSYAIIGTTLYGGFGGDNILYRWNGAAWVAVSGQLNGAGLIHIVNSGGLIYGCAQGTFINFGGCFKVWNGVNAWTDLDISPVFPSAFFFCDLINFGGVPYFSVCDNSGGYSVWKWVGGAVVNVIPVFTGFDAVASAKTCYLRAFAGNLYLINDAGKMFTATNPPVAVTGAAHSGSAAAVPNLEIELTLVYGGELYYGTRITGAVQLGSLFKWNGVNAWISLVPYDATKLPIQMLRDFLGSIYTTRGDTKVFQFDGVSTLSQAGSKPGAALRQSFVNGGVTYISDSTSNNAIYSMSLAAAGVTLWPWM